MSEQLYDEIPSLDLANFFSDEPGKKDAFVQELGQAFQKIGFVAIRNHGLSDELVNLLYKVFKEFFSLADEVKLKYQVPNLAGQRGYTPKQQEHAKGRTTGDLKEFYHIGQLIDPADPITDNYPENIFPGEIPDLKKIALEAYQTLESTARQILRAIALYLGREEAYFESRVKSGNSILRAIHYYPIENPDELDPDAVRAAEHGDINLITLLMGASAEGLQILRKDGQWVPVTALPDQIVVNVGDMLERHSNNRLRSTIHRVVNPPREFMHTSRYSMPFFMHPRSDMELNCLDTCVSAEQPKQYEDISAGEFLEQRLKEIGLKK